MSHRTDADVEGAVAVASPAVEAGGLGAVVQRRLAVGAGVPGRAAASVAALTRVEASSAIPTRLVVGAEVEVLIAEEAAPALVAETVPRLHASAVHAPGVALALVAKWTLPAGLAPKKTTCSIISAS